MEIIIFAITVVCGTLFFWGLISGVVSIPWQNDFALEIYEAHRGSGRGCLYWFAMLILLSGTLLSAYVAVNIDNIIGSWRQ